MDPAWGKRKKNSFGKFFLATEGNLNTYCIPDVMELLIFLRSWKRSAFSLVPSFHRWPTGEKSAIYS